MTDINEGINAIVDLFSVLVPGNPADETENTWEVGDVEALKRALTAREDNILDGLRLAAMQQGLMPATTQLVLIQSGLGSPQDLATVTAVHARHVAEMEELRRQIEGNG